MITRLLCALALALVSVSGPALAASDLTVTFIPPAAPAVYQDATYTVRVNNIGNQNAANVTLAIALPTTGSSPTHTVLGLLGARSAGCNLSGTSIVCSLGTINKSKNKSVFFTIALPYSSAPITFNAVATTTSSENSTANNSATHTTALTYYSVDVGAFVTQGGGSATVENNHCTGTNLTSWFICTLFPSSITSHTAVYAADGTITFPGEDPSFTGAWSQPNATTLVFDYFDNGTLVASFVGRGVPGDCFEGVTTFVGSTHTAGYEVCP
jgi:hypothetical protein